MLFCEYRTIADFRREVVSFLMEHEAVNNLPLGIIASLESWRERGGDPFLGSIKTDHGQLALVLLRTPPHNLVLAGHGPRLDGALKLAARSLAEGQVPLPGVIGTGELAGAFATAWSEATGDRASVSMRQRIYRLDAVNPVPRSPGRFRRANADDIELVARWAGAFTEEAFGTPPAAVEARERAARLIDRGRLYLWEDARPVSMAARSRETRNGIVINEVYTPPEFRRKGYATSCVAALSRLLLDQGASFCCLYTDLANPTSNSIYQRIGYRPVADSVVYDFDSREK